MSAKKPPGPESGLEVYFSSGFFRLFISAKKPPGPEVGLEV